MIPLVVVESPGSWPLHLPPRTEVVTARAYLTDPRYLDLRKATVFNLCRTYGYQTVGYYVSLLAAARGHKPLPSVATLQDLRLSPVIRIVGEDLEEQIERSLAPLKGSAFELSIYFGRNVARRYDRLSRALFNQFPAPFLRASFARDGGWKLQGMRAIASSEIPPGHREFVIEQAEEYFARPRHAVRPRQAARYDLAILHDPQQLDSPSDERAIRCFVRAADRLGIQATVIDRDDYGRIAEFDALFLRETTYVDHHTYRFARRAAAEGLVVIDDPESIVRCTNKVFQAEVFARSGIPCPRTLVVHQGNRTELVAQLGLPLVLKRPDSSFSHGVVRVEDERDLQAKLEEFFEHSELVIAQEFVPSGFDWRIGVLNGRALYACKYHMARGHWQIIDHEARGERRYGRVETLAIEAAPAQAVALAVRAARRMGDGLYGVDVKQSNGRLVVMEVNDNPNLDVGCEDAVLKEELYLAVMRTFRERLDARGVKEGSP